MPSEITSWVTENGEEFRHCHRSRHFPHLLIYFRVSLKWSEHWSWFFLLLLFEFMRSYGVFVTHFLLDTVFLPPRNGLAIINLWAFFVGWDEGLYTRGLVSGISWYFPVGNSMIKVSEKKNSKFLSRLCSKLTIKTSELLLSICNLFNTLI